MKRVKTYLEEMYKFNDRVLYYGQVEKGKTYTLSEFRKIVFFNKVFLSNTKELFVKHGKSKYIFDYHFPRYETFHHNMDLITSAISCEKKDDPGKYLRTEIIPFRKADTYTYPENAYLFATKLEEEYIAFSILDQDDLKKCISISLLKDVITYLNKQFRVDSTCYIGAFGSGKFRRIRYVEFFGKIKLYQNLFSSHAKFVKNQHFDIQLIENYLKSLDTSRDKEYPPARRITLDQALERDILIEYPYVHFNHWVDMVNEIIQYRYTDVKRVNMTIYRISKKDDVIYLMRSLADRGIYVRLNVENKVLGQQNWKYIRELQNYPNMEITSFMDGQCRVHGKLFSVEFKNGSILSQICTGNYNSDTTGQYTDLCLYTSDYAIGRAISNMFNIMEEKNYEKFPTDVLVTQVNFRKRFVELIKEQSHINGYISFKCNALTDSHIVKALRRAAKHGCKIDLTVRGACMFVPKREWDARVKSIVWDKLEHSRVYAFGRKDPIIYMGSLDLIQHKIDARLEALVQVADSAVKRYLVKYLDYYIRNEKFAWIMDCHGDYIKMIK